MPCGCAPSAGGLEDEGAIFCLRRLCPPGGPPDEKFLVVGAGLWFRTSLVSRGGNCEKRSAVALEWFSAALGRVC